MGGGGESWSLTAKLCDSCKTSGAALFCRTDSAFLCLGCDQKVHAASKLGSRHARVWVCDVCEQAPASVTCKADAAALCVTCDRDIHSANPLARRHERFPVVPFYDSPPPAAAKHYAAAEGDGGGGSYLSDSEEAEAASWLLPNPNPSSKTLDHGQLKSSDYLFSGIDPCFDLDLMAGDQKPHQHQHQRLYGSTDGVVPVGKNMMLQQQAIPSLVDGVPVCYDHMDDYTGSKPFLYNFTSQSFSQSVSSSSLEVGVVPDHNAMADVSTTNTLAHQSSGETVVAPVSGVDREAKVLRYREKRKNRKFEKLIRYASRKAYAETRPRIKGRFAKRSEVVDLDCIYTSSPMDAGGYSAVPTF